jgi:hypothetical protein
MLDFTSEYIQNLFAGWRLAVISDGVTYWKWIGYA